METFLNALRGNQNIDIAELVMSTHCAVIVSNAKGQVMFANNKAEEIMAIFDSKGNSESLFSIYGNDIPLEDVLTNDVIISRMEVRKDNFAFLFDVFPIINHCDEKQLIMVITDLNHFNQIVNEIESNHKISERLDSIIEYSYDGIYITDGEGKTLKINASYERITGLDRTKMLGKYMNELVDEGYISRSGSVLAIQNRKTFTLNQTFRTGKKALITSKPVFDDNGDILLVVTNVRDMTELYQLKTQLEEQTQLTNKYYHEAIILKNQILDTADIVAEDKCMIDVLTAAQKVAITDVAVSIQGESGVGKEVVAKFIHKHSLRSDHHFIKVNCGAIPETLIESEFFGYEKGAYTGANKEGKPGLFELADGGTLFLDEIGELPFNMQVKLLRVLQEGELMRIGGIKAIKIDVRIISATNRNLRDMVDKGQFRKDLFYRLNVVPLLIPPLRERANDLIKLTHVFFEEMIDKYTMDKVLAYDVLDTLLNYSWPGNIRELKNVISRMVIMCPEKVITPQYIPSEILDVTKSLKFKTINGVMPLKKAVQEVEHLLIENAYKEFGNVRDAAKALGIDASTFVRKRNRSV